MDSGKISQMLNIKGREVFNSLFILENGYQFGNGLESVSSVLGKNMMMGTLSPVGVLIVQLLNLFEPNHAVKSIKREI